MQALRDWILEQRIKRAQEALVDATGDDLRAKASKFTALLNRRSKRQVARMEADMMRKALGQK